MRSRALEQAFLAGYSREEIGKAPALEQLRQDPRLRSDLRGKPRQRPCKALDETRSVIKKGEP